MNLCNYDWNISLLNVASSVKPQIKKVREGTYRSSDYLETGFNIEIPFRDHNIHTYINKFRYIFERVEYPTYSYKVKKKTANGNNILYVEDSSYEIWGTGEWGMIILYERDFDIDWDEKGFYLQKSHIFTINFALE